MTLTSTRTHGIDVEDLEPQTGQMPREMSTRATRAASLGLAGVVLCLALFSIFAAYTTQTQVERARQLQLVHDSYETANSAVIAGEAAQLEYLLAPTAEHKAELGEATEAVTRAFNLITARGSERDSALATSLKAFHVRYLLVYVQMAAAAAVGDQVESARLHAEEDPLYHAMRDQIAAATRERLEEADAAYAELDRTSQWVLVESPVVFAVAFGLLIGLWRILEGYHRAARKTYREIEQLSKLRSEFVSIVSHEFRTPLTGIQGFSEMMRDEAMTMPEMKEFAADINKDARRLARLITDMLDLDRMESGRMTLNSEPVDLNRVVGETAARFRLSAADHPIELELDLAMPVVMGDADRLTQVLTNLVSNAIKYSPSGGAVEVRTECAEQTVTLTVRDHGMGIPAAQLETVFDRYSRVLTSETQGIQGTGLGLPIVRQIVGLFEGRVWATSETGHGSIVHVELPLAGATALPLAA